MTAKNRSSWFNTGLPYVGGAGRLHKWAKTRTGTQFQPAVLYTPPVVVTSSPVITITQPCILWALMGSTLVLGGGTTGTIVVKIGASTQTLTYPAVGSFDAGTAYYIGAGGANDLLTMLAATLATFSGGPTWTVTQDNLGHVTISGNGTDFQILPSSTVDLTTFGLDNVATWSSTAGVLAIVKNHKGAWYPGCYQEIDTLDALPFVGKTTQTVDGAPRTVRIATTRKERDLGWRALDAGVVRDALAAVTAGLYGTFERAWEESIGYGYPFLFYPDRTVRSSTSYVIYELREDPNGWPWKRSDGDGILFWDVDLICSRVSA